MIGGILDFFINKTNFIEKYRALVLIFVLLFLSFLFVEIYNIKLQTKNNTIYIKTLKKQAILQQLEKIKAKSVDIKYIDLFFVAEYCLELKNTDPFVENPCQTVLAFFYNFK
jgi:hypothetical protein